MSELYEEFSQEFDHEPKAIEAYGQGIDINSSIVKAVRTDPQTAHQTTYWTAKTKRFLTASSYIAWKAING